MTPRTVLITGGSGFVGSYVARDLLRAGSRPVVVDTVLEPGILELVVPEPDRDGLVLERADVADGWLLLRLCERHAVSAIVHLASPLTKSVRESPAAALGAMVGGTANVCEVARALRLPRVVWASSLAVFGSPAAPVGPGAPR